MQLLQRVVSLFSIGALLVASTTAVVASSGSYGAYGGGSSQGGDCLSLDQMVSNPAVTTQIEYIDNILPQGAKYKPNQAFYARVKVKNTGRIVAPDVVVTNEIPKCFTYIGGPGSLNKGGNVLTIDIGDLQPQEEHVLYITYKVGDATCFPNQPVYCATNKMRAVTDVCNPVEDHAQLCVEPQVLGLTKGGMPIDLQETPQAGPANLIFVLAGQIALGAFGLFLKNRANA